MRNPLCPAAYKLSPEQPWRSKMSTTSVFTGGCACEAIRYETTAEPVLMLHCHCRDCQRASGGPFSSFVIVPTEAFKLLQGELRFHASPSEMGGMTRRGFCPDCGARLWSGPTASLNLLRSEPRAWMMPVGSTRK